MCPYFKGINRRDFLKWATAGLAGGYVALRAEKSLAGEFAKKR